MPPWPKTFRTRYVPSQPISPPPCGGCSREVGSAAPFATLAVGSVCPCPPGGVSAVQFSSRRIIASIAGVIGMCRPALACSALSQSHLHAPNRSPHGAHSSKCRATTSLSSGDSVPWASCSKTEPSGQVDASFMRPPCEGDGCQYTGAIRETPKFPGGPASHESKRGERQASARRSPCTGDVLKKRSQRATPFCPGCIDDH